MSGKTAVSSRMPLVAVAISLLLVATPGIVTAQNETTAIGGINANTAEIAQDNLHKKMNSLKLHGDSSTTPSKKMIETIGAYELINCIRLFVDKYGARLPESMRTQCDDDVTNMIAVLHSFSSNQTLQNIALAYLKFRGIQ